ncbi:MAG: hypothetical protein R3D26_22620 [Cyanobacteriota/Melainabacteria group bacterium]
MSNSSQSKFFKGAAGNAKEVVAAKVTNPDAQQLEIQCLNRRGSISKNSGGSTRMLVDGRINGRSMEMLFGIPGHCLPAISASPT